MSGSMLGLQRFGGITAQLLRRAGYSTTVRAATATTSTPTTNSDETIEGPERAESATGVVVKKSKRKCCISTWLLCTYSPL